MWVNQILRLLCNQKHRRDLLWFVTITNIVALLPPTCMHFLVNSTFPANYRLLKQKSWVVTYLKLHLSQKPSTKLLSQETYSKVELRKEWNDLGRDNLRIPTYIVQQLGCNYKLIPLVYLIHAPRRQDLPQGANIKEREKESNFILCTFLKFLSLINKLYTNISSKTCNKRSLFPVTDVW